MSKCVRFLGWSMFSLFVHTFTIFVAGIAFDIGNVVTEVEPFA